MRPHVRSLSRQRGFGLLGMVALLLVLATTVALGYLSTNAHRKLQSAAQQQAALRWADNLIQSFALMHARLPCASASRGGVEDCSIMTKGWLPVATLLQGASTQTGYTIAMQSMRYMAYRGNGTSADPDLANATDAYTPQAANNVAFASYPSTLSSADLCKKFQALASVSSDPWTTSAPASLTGRTDRAYVVDTGTGSPRNVAYAIAAAGGANGFGQANFSDANASNDATMESPARPLSASYGDRVLAHEAPSLANVFQCGTLLASLDALATSASVTPDVLGLQTGNAQSALALSNQLMPQVIVFDGLSSAVRVEQVATSIMKASDSVFLATINPFEAATQALAQIFFQVPVATNVANLAMAAYGLAGDSFYQLTYLNAGEEAQYDYVWKGAQAALIAADNLGLASGLQ